jgi:hypothetical protein
MAAPTSQAYSERLVGQLTDFGAVPPIFSESSSQLAQGLVTVGRWSLLLLIPPGLLTLAVLAALAVRRYLLRRPPVLRADPLADLSDLGGLSPRDTVLAAYGRLLRALERLGHPRPERLTPYETLDGLPVRLQELRDPARSLTDLYVKAAYSGEAVAPEEGGQAVAVLRGLKGSRRIDE